MGCYVPTRERITSNQMIYNQVPEDSYNIIKNKIEDYKQTNCKFNSI